jgi:hypothetical protein
VDSDWHRCEPRWQRDHDIELARARWSLRFYCWRNMLVLSVGTVVAAEAILASIEGRPPQKDIIELVSRLY